jgi:hypothetical protein
VTFDGAQDELVERARDALACALPSGSMEPADE